MTTSIVDLLPKLLGSLLLLALGWVIAIIISRFFLRILKAIKLEDFLKEHKMEDALGTVKISDVLGKIVKYYVILIFLQAVVANVWLGTISDFMSELLMKVPALAAAVLIVLASVLLGEYLKEMIMELSKSSLVKLAARTVKVLVIYVGVTQGLATIPVDTTLLTGIFLTVLQGVVFGIALAIAIAFGLGGQEDAKDIIKNSRKQLKL